MQRLGYSVIGRLGFMDRRGIAPPLGSIVINAALDSSPLLGNGNANSNGFGDGRSVSRRGGISVAARFFRRVSNRRMMREPSVLVRETAAEQLEERQSGWAYSRPVVVLDLVWNLAFVIVAIVVLVLSREERTRTPLRVWVLGYTLQCVLHMVCVLMEYRRRYRQHALASMGSDNWANSVTTHYESEDSGESDSEDGDDALEHASLAKRLESVNTMFSFVWWIVGFYWIASGGQALTSESPLLYWLSVVFLAFDVFFVVFCIALACIIGIAVCCCLPCIIAILYAVADQEGASEEDISSLPKYTFRRLGKFENNSAEKLEPSGGSIILVDHSESPHERILTAEDAECCICLSPYDDEIELRELPCSHHFHCACIDKWLRINATCPLCKYNIMKRNNNVREEV